MANEYGRNHSICWTQVYSNGWHIGESWTKKEKTTGETIAISKREESRRNKNGIRYTQSLDCNLCSCWCIMYRLRRVFNHRPLMIICAGHYTEIHLVWWGTEYKSILDFSITSAIFAIELNVVRVVVAAINSCHYQIYKISIFLATCDIICHNIFVFFFYSSKKIPPIQLRQAVEMRLKSTRNTTSSLDWNKKILA